MKSGWPLLLCLLALASPAPAARRSPQKKPAESTASGLRYEDLRVGTGPAPLQGQLVTVHYVGTLKDGTVFDSSIERGEPVRFVLGMGQVIAGWEEGLRTMRVGGKRRLIIPPALGYGNEKAGAIPPGSELIFVVELLAVE